jgi:hypothetical protein
VYGQLFIIVATKNLQRAILLESEVCLISESCGECTIDMRLWILRISREFKNYSVICSHVQTDEKSERLQDRLYGTKAEVNVAPLSDIKIMNAKFGKEIWTGIDVTTRELHYELNDNISVRENNTQDSCGCAMGLCHINN